jgi:anti-anti-sigma factor
MSFYFTIDRPSGEPRQSEPLSIRLSGRMTLGPQLIDFSRRVADILASRRSGGVSLDVSAVDDLDSAGLGELVVLYTTAGQNGCRVCLVNPTPRIVRLLETTKLSGILPYFPNAGEAAAWLSA